MIRSTKKALGKQDEYLGLGQAWPPMRWK